MVQHDNEGRLVNPFAIDPGDGNKVTVWGDLAIIDNGGSSDREGLWNYWDSLVAFFQKMGILGYRCDAAYQVPAPLWERLISSANKREPGTMFYAETLGCQLSQIEALAHVGFDYLFIPQSVENNQPSLLSASVPKRSPIDRFPESQIQIACERVSGNIEAQKEGTLLSAFLKKA
jgi:hypothetical protein